MIPPTSNQNVISDELLHNYFKRLVNSFFKILPMRENGEQSLGTYLVTLQQELMGCGSFVPQMDKDPSFLTLLSILQFMIDNPNIPVVDIRRDVFNAITVCNELRSRYMRGDKS